jgi:ATP-binding cassette subfamily B protein
MGAILVINKSLMLGEMIASYSLASALLAPVNRLTETNIALMGASVASQRLLDLLLVKKESGMENLSFKFRNSLLIQKGYFKWPSGEALFKNLNIEIQKGKITALLGKSGSGKSTLVKLIQRIYNFDSADFFIDGLPVEKVCLNDFRENIGVVPQEVKIFNGTLAENILCGRIPKDKDKLRDRVKALDFDFFISRFPQGYASIIGEDRRRLSGGEKQLLGLLRALYNSPELLIIDEGFCSVDHYAQFLILKIVTEYAQDHAVLLISHHPGIVCNADYLYVLHNKMITEQGSPSELLLKKGIFYKTWIDQKNTITILTN